jgi:hypothetical protein
MTARMTTRTSHAARITTPVEIEVTQHSSDLDCSKDAIGTYVA